MTQRPKVKFKRGIANTFGAFGYLFGALQWFWVVMLYLTVIQSTVVLLTPPAGERTPQLPAFTFSLPSQLELVIIMIVVVVMVALTVYGLLKMPFAVAKTGRKVVHKTTEKAVPLVIKAQHKKDSKKLRARLTTQIILILKIALVLLPVMLTASSGLLPDLPIGYLVALVVGGVVAGLSILMFVIQYALAGWLRVKMTELW